jgi:light-regulated signal transduction histidine kinase (bacteriophytochrome)
MSDIIGKLLLLAREDAASEPADFQEVNVKDLIIELSTDLEGLAQEKGVAFSLGSMDDLRVKGDRFKLRQLFLNILDNAIRYTPSGGSVSSSLVRKNGSAIVSISDTGMGMPAEDLPLIFDRFIELIRRGPARTAGWGLVWRLPVPLPGCTEELLKSKAKSAEAARFKLPSPCSNRRWFSWLSHGIKSAQARPGIIDDRHTCPAACRGEPGVGGAEGV